MPADRNTRYEPLPPIPTYDEAVASGSGSRSSQDWRQADGPESQSLLISSHGGSSHSSSRRPNGYRPPTVETDDEEDSLWGSDDAHEDDDGDEREAVRREMQEMEVEEPRGLTSRSSIWGKRIPFRLSLPQWRWTWRWRLPAIRLPSGPPSEAAAASPPDSGSGTGADTSTSAATRRWWAPKWNTTAIFIIFARLCALFLVLGFLYLLFASDFLSGMARRMNAGLRFDPEDVRQFVQKSVDGRRLRASVKHFSNYAHIAGTEGDYALAMDVESMFNRAGLEQISVDEYFVYLNYPKEDGRAVQILDKDGKEAVWSAKLEEEEVGGETAGRQTYAFHGHSKSGDVKGPLIYANYGSREDFKRLKDLGIDTKGAIALVRYYGTQGDRALKVKAAELAGFAGCIIYSDPADDGFLKGEVAPNGRFMPADGVQRGAVSLMSWVVGDVLTPGWESKKGLPRMLKEDSPGLVKIPSLPLAWRDAQVLLQHLKGHGQKVPSDWEGGVPDVKEWWTGDVSSPIIRLKNEQDEEDQKPIWNVYGKIEGSEQALKSIIIGNHRDAWTAGATDPHSGTAVMIELARIFGDLRSRGWVPLRTIEFMSWDGEEYNLIGSTEFVEKNVDFLRTNGLAYINLDTAVWGDELKVRGSPVFQQALLRCLSRVYDPNQNATLRDLWDRRGSKLEGLGAGSDYVAFQDIAGTSSVDLAFEGMGYPYHSSYDTFDNMERFGDPHFVYHSLLTEVIGLLILELSDRPILPFDMINYGARLGDWVHDLEKWTSGKAKAAGLNQPGKPSFSIQPLKDAVVETQKAVKDFSKWEMEWDAMVMGGGGWEPNNIEDKRCAYNDRMSQFETALLDLEDGGGIPNRTQFKHVVFGPQLWSGYDEAFFPAIRDTVEAGEWDLAAKFVAKTANLIRGAAVALSQ